MCCVLVRYFWRARTHNHLHANSSDILAHAFSFNPGFKYFFFVKSKHKQEQQYIFLCIILRFYFTDSFKWNSFFNTFCNSFLMNVTTYFFSTFVSTINTIIIPDSHGLYLRICLVFVITCIFLKKKIPSFFHHRIVFESNYIKYAIFLNKKKLKNRYLPLQENDEWIYYHVNGFFPSIFFFFKYFVFC